MTVVAGAAERERVPAAVPLRRVLRVRASEGAGDAQHHLDRRVHLAAPPDQDRQLHTHPVSTTLGYLHERGGGGLSTVLRGYVRSALSESKTIFCFGEIFD